jgi:hypothetical protein
MTDMTEKNIWRDVASDGLVEAMRLCGCDSKYTDGCASDFEKLCELLRVSDKLCGHGALAKFIDKLNRDREVQIGYKDLTVANATAIWKRETLHGEVRTDLCKNIIDENYKYINNGLYLNTVEKPDLKYADFVESIKDKLACEDTLLFIELKNKSFVSPNPYLAKKTYENCQIIQEDILLCQILCEITLDNKCQKKQIYLDVFSNVGYFERLVSFLDKHSMSVRIAVRVRETDSPEDVLAICKLSNDNCFVTPYMCVTKNKNEQEISSFCQRLSEIYPIGMLEIIRE